MTTFSDDDNTTATNTTCTSRIISTNTDRQQSKERKVLFVTVGTTLFEALIEATTTTQSLEWMYSNGYTNLIIQYGKGRKPIIPEVYKTKLSIELYNFKSSLRDDMIFADTIISHAGAGTIMEALRMKKHRLIVVINTILMDNHQIELATALGNRNHLYVINDASELLFQYDDCNNNDDTKINKKWNDIESFQAKLYTGGNENDFPRIVNHFFGFDTATNGSSYSSSSTVATSSNLSKKNE